VDNFELQLRLRRKLSLAISSQPEQLCARDIILNKEGEMSINKELSDAVLLGNLEKTENLLKAKAVVDDIDKYGRTILFDAVLKNNSKMVELLCSYKANVNHKDKDGKTPLHFAVQENFYEMSKVLIELGADVNAQDKEGNTIICEAVFSSKGKGDVILLLKEKGADPSIENKHGVSAIGLAETIGNYNVISFLK
jgi:ankyrin repeat protein